MGFFFKDKILIVEDAKPLSAALKRKMSRSGFKVYLAPTYEEAVHILATVKNIQALWLDHYLKGGKTGLDVLRYVRSHAQYKNLLVFLVTASSPAEVHKYEELGVARSYIKSDYRMEVIARDIRSLLKTMQS